MAVSILFNEHVLSSWIIWFVLVVVILLIVDGFYCYTTGQKLGYGDDYGQIQLIYGPLNLPNLPIQLPLQLIIQSKLNSWMSLLFTLVFILSCVLCIRCCQCLCVVNSWLSLLFTQKGQSRINNTETLTTSDTPDAGQNKHSSKQKGQSRINNTETLTTSDTQDTAFCLL
jgi:magnesium-transporting ATPase (P-type)